MSRFSTFRGIPVAVFGAIWFAVAALLSVERPDRRAPSVRESVPGYLFALSTLALAVVLYLGYASFVLLKAVCLLCLTTYAAVIGLFLVSGAATSISHDYTASPRRPRSPRARRQPARASSLAVLFFAGAASTLAFFPREGAATSPASRRRAAAAGADARISAPSSSASWPPQPRVPLVIPADGAKVLIVKFNDFQCPACGQSYLQYKPILAKYDAEHPGAVQAGA